MDYGEILTRGWQIIWKHKVLWIFGILASCNGGSNGPGNNSRYTNQGGPNPFERWFGNIGSGEMAMIVVMIIAIACIVAIVVTFLSTIGRIGLIRGASRADQDLNTHLTFGDLFRDSLRYFWRVFLLNLILTILGIVVFGGVALVGLAGGLSIAAVDNSNQGLIAGMGVGMAIFLACLCCLLVPVFVVLSVVLQIVYNAIVVEDLSIGAGIGRGWEIFKANLGSIALLAVILLVIGLIGGFIAGAPLFLMALPMMASAMAGADARPIGFVISMLCFVGYLPILLALQGLLTSYVQSAWTVAYRRFIGLRSGTGGAAVFDLNTPAPVG